VIGRTDEGLPISGRVVIPERELSWRFSRSSGPGGQGVNTSDSRVELSFDVARSPSLPSPYRDRALERLASRLAGGVLTVVASERRSQLQNRELARQRLAGLLRQAIAAPPRVRRATRPRAGAVQARLDAKKHRSRIKRMRRPDADA
jgi:ribosome-associated protein